MQGSLAVLIAAHFVGDFLLQPDWMQQRKHRAWASILHALVVGLISYLFFQQWNGWLLSLFLSTAHFSIDTIKLRLGQDSARAFCVDQVAHITLTAALFCLCRASGWSDTFSGLGGNWMVWLGGFVAAVQAAGYLIGKVAMQLQKENALSESLRGLSNGGQLIGVLERALIYLLVMIGQPGGIGFLVAAKSVLRFGEARDDQKLAEYVLIGTLLSFGLAILAANVSRWALEIL